MVIFGCTLNGAKLMGNSMVLVDLVDGFGLGFYVIVIIIPVQCSLP
jgi:hypothetical protein